MLFDAFVRDLDGVRHLAGGGAGEGAQELVGVDAAVVQLAFHRLVHGREEFGLELVEELVDVDVGHGISAF